MVTCSKCQSDKVRPIGPDYSDFIIYRCSDCGRDSIIWRAKTHSLDSFPAQFWCILGVECVRHSNTPPQSIEQALWQMSGDDWTKMVESLFANTYQLSSTVGVEQIMDIIKKTNTCTNLDFPVEVWINKDFKIKVYK